MGNNNFLLQKIWGDTLALIGSSGQVPEDVLGYFSGWMERKPEYSFQVSYILS